ncbi:MAG: inorganic diphosphatase [Mycobacterium sp.]
MQESDNKTITPTSESTETKPTASPAAASPAGAPAAEGCYAITHPFGFPQPSDIDADGVMVVVEIPQGSANKYEIDPATGQIVLDRVQSMPVAYPANYGSIPQSLGGDGDPLDALVLTREPLAPGVQVRVRPIGMLNMIDGGEADEKVIAVPVDDVDPHFSDYQNITDLPAIQQQAIEQFFSVYKNLPEGRKEVELNGFAEAGPTANALKQALDSYRQSCS